MKKYNVYGIMAAALVGACALVGCAKDSDVSGTDVTGNACLHFYAYLSTSCFTSLRRSYQPYDERVRRNNGSLCLYKVQACASYGFQKQPALPFPYQPQIRQ